MKLFDPLHIRLSSLKSYTSILDLMKLNNIHDYVYWFSTDQEILKYGESANAIGPVGERVYRQAGHLAGWHAQLDVNTSGKDMRDIAADYRAKHGVELNRNDVTLHIINLTSCANPKFECERLERNLIDKHIELFGHPPIGNKDYQTKFAHRRHKNEKLLENFVEFV